MDSEPFHFSERLKIVFGVCVNILTGSKIEAKDSKKVWIYRQNNNNQEPHIPEPVDIMMNQRYW